jgi:hypothetical protein
MKTRIRLIAIAGALMSAIASSGSSVYIVAGQALGPGQFGTIDLTTGQFQQIGPTEPEGYFGLAPGSNGSLLSLTYASNLDSINPTSGNHSQVGPTGLANCLVPQPSCPATSGLTIAGYNGKVFATDIAGDLYTLNLGTAAATLLSNHTGLPGGAIVPGSQNPDGSLNFVDEAMWQAGNKLYLTYDAWVFNGTATPQSVLAAPQLFTIDPNTGAASLVGPITGFGLGEDANVGLGAGVYIDGTSYVFDDLTGQIATLDLATGLATPVGSFDPSAGVIQGAVATPEPSSCLLLMFGIACLSFAGVRGMHRTPRVRRYRFRF